MNIRILVENYINSIPLDEPIFVDDVKRHISGNVDKNEKENVLKNVNVILNRFKKDGIIKSVYKGLYYKPKKGSFGDVPLSSEKLRKAKYIEDSDGNIKGYITGPKLYNSLGLTNLVPNVVDVVTNECKHYKQYDEVSRTCIIKPKILITNDNYRYLQFVDLLENKDNIPIQCDNAEKVYYDFIKKNKLDFEKLIMYVRETNSKNALNKLLSLAR